MNIIISNTSDKPIYEQIVNSIKDAILNGELIGGEALPSIRSLAKDLRISNITTKRAYEELVNDGFIEAISSKGYFVKNKSKDFLKEEILTKIEDKLLDVINMSNNYNISKSETIEMLENLYKESI